MKGKSFEPPQRQKGGGRGQFSFPTAANSKKEIKEDEI
jgi:hypothetical protein